MTMRLQLFAKLRLFTGRDWLEPRPNKPLCLLLYAAYHEGWVGREDLSFLFWPDASEKSAQQNLRRLIHRAKEFDFAKTLEVEKTRLRWAVDTDVKAFRQAVGEQHWTEAVSLYKGPLLEGFTLRDTSGFEAWLDLERRDLETTWREAAIHQVSHLEKEEAFAKAANLLQTLLRRDPLAEDILQRYVRNAYLGGERDAALGAFDDFARQLEEELDLAPLETTIKLVQTIRESRDLRQSVASKAKTHASVPLSVLRPPRLVGREDEMAHIRASNASMILIAGEAGVGKTRLMVEVAPNALALKCQEGLQSVPYYPVITLIRSLLAQGVAVPNLNHYLEDLARLVPEIAPNLVPQPADPESGRSRLFEALALYFEAVSHSEKVRGVQLLIDDLQWADDSTLALLVYLANRNSIRMIGSYRVHEVTAALATVLKGLEANRLLSQISLHPLAPDRVTELMASLIGIETGPPIFSAWLHGGTGGNPMFMLETLKSLFEAGTLRSENNDWQTDVDKITKDYHEIELPKLVADVIQRRLQRLSEGTERILKTAAVVGNGFSVKLLSKVSGLSELAVLEALEETETGGLTQGEAFSHDLVRQSIYNGLSPTRRKLLHAQIAASLEAEPARLAEHWLLANEPQKAALAWHVTGQGYLQRGLLEEARELFERAGKHATDPNLIERIAFDTASLYFEQAAYDEAATRVDLLASNAEDPAIRALALNLQAQLLLKKGQIQTADNVVRTGLKLLKNVEPTPQRDAITWQLLLTQNITTFELGHHQEAIDLLEPKLPALRAKGSSLELAQALTSVAVVYNHLGNYEKALGLHLEALAIAERLGARHIQVDIAQNLVYCYIELGQSEAALPVGEQALELGYYAMTDSLRANLAAAYIKLKRYTEAIGHYEALTESRESTVRLVAWGRLAGLYAWTDQESKAVAAVEHALKLYDSTQIEIAKARVVVSALRYGTARQLAQVSPLVEEVSAYALPPYLREEFDEALEISKANRRNS